MSADLQIAGIAKIAKIENRKRKRTRYACDAEDRHQRQIPQSRFFLLALRSATR